MRFFAAWQLVVCCLMVSTTFSFSLKATLNLSPALRLFWYPVHFSSTLEKVSKQNKENMAPFTLFGEDWVLWRDPTTGTLSCVRDMCTHRGVRLSLGDVNPITGCLKCRYHGWEYGTNGCTTLTPQLSGRLMDGTLDTLPVREHDGLLWVYPGLPLGEQDKKRQEDEWKKLIQVTTLPIPRQGGPKYFKHGEMEWEIPIDHGLLIENVLDVAHIPFAHRGSFGKGWNIPERVEFRNERGLFASPANGVGLPDGVGVEIGGHWFPKHFDHAFLPPCMVLADCGIVKEKKQSHFEHDTAFQTRAADCRHHFHQLHICLPSRHNHVRYLFRWHTTFLGFTKAIPFISRILRNRTDRVLQEDLGLLQSQQENMERYGDKVDYCKAVSYDSLSAQYRVWRNALEDGARGDLVESYRKEQVESN